MVSEWHKITIGELLSTSGGEIKTGPFGTKLKAAEYSDVGVPVISVGEVQFGRLVLHNRTPKVPPSVTNRMPEYLLCEGDIVFGRKGAVERSARVKLEQEGWFLGSDGIRLRLPSVCDSSFVSYQFLSEVHKQWMIQHAAGTTMASLNEKIIKLVPLTLPPLPEQKAIAHVLGTLDDRIELNRRMNETLEGMAQALFKSWFVDFDPVIDNALASGKEIPEELNEKAQARSALGDKRKPLPEAIRNLFPDEFVYSDEMGWIPLGWEVGTLGKVVSQRNERIVASEITESMPYVPIDCISANSLFLGESKDGIEAKSSLIRFYQGDILFGAMRPYFHKVCIAPFDGTTRTTAFVLMPRRNEDFSFSVLQLHQQVTIDYATAHSTGTTIPYAKWKGSLSDMPILIPSKEVRKTFNDLYQPLLKAIPPKYFKNITLATLRDTLLPKLLSGELRIPDAEKIVEDVN